jgi:hypothetical protein
VFFNFSRKYLPPIKIGCEIFRSKIGSFNKTVYFLSSVYFLPLNDFFILVASIVAKYRVTSIVAKYIIYLCICWIIRVLFSIVLTCLFERSLCRKIFQIKLQGISVCFNGILLAEITKFVLV